MFWSADRKTIHRVSIKTALESPIEEKLSHIIYPPKPSPQVTVTPVVEGYRDAAPPKPVDVDELCEIFDAPSADDTPEVIDPNVPIIIETN